MSFKELYKAVNKPGLTPISAGQIEQYIKNLTDFVEIKVYSYDFDVEYIRGYFDVKDPVNRPYADQQKHAVILISKNLETYCWKRAVIIKELMHVFDKDSEKTSDHTMLVRLLEELNDTMISKTGSLQYRSESDALWKSRLIMCPALKRAELIRLRNNGSTNLQLADSLKIPEEYIDPILSSAYLDALDKFL